MFGRVLLNFGRVILVNLVSGRDIVFIWCMVALLSRLGAWLRYVVALVFLVLLFCTFVVWSCYFVDLVFGRVVPLCCALSRYFVSLVVVGAISLIWCLVALFRWFGHWLRYFVDLVVGRGMLLTWCLVAQCVDLVLGFVILLIWCLVA